MAIVANIATFTGLETDLDYLLIVPICLFSIGMDICGSGDVEAVYQSGEI
jgi:hypothetical protein